MLRTKFVLGGLFTLIVAMAFQVSAKNVVTYKIKPSSIDSRIQNDDFDNWVMLDLDESKLPPLVVFMPGTGGKPGNGDEMDLMNLIVDRGYRLAWISFDNDTSVSKICPHSVDPDCSLEFRRMRVDGIAPAPVDNSPAETVVSRLTHLLEALDRDHPSQHWDRYLVDGRPNWRHIVVSGHSTGAGMAAYIAKTRKVKRVVLFSSPWDDIDTSDGHKTAPWLSTHSATSMHRWYAEYNKREDTADLLVDAYTALRIPQKHLYVFSLDLPPEFAKHKHHNPYHLIVIRDPRYAPQWRAMFGSAAGLAPAH